MTRSQRGRYSVSGIVDGSTCDLVRGQEFRRGFVSDPGRGVGLGLDHPDPASTGGEVGVGRPGTLHSAPFARRVPQGPTPTLLPRRLGFSPVSPRRARPSALALS